MQQNKRKHLFKLHCTVSTDNRQFSAIIPQRQRCQGVQDLEAACQMRVGMGISEYFSWSRWSWGLFHLKTTCYGWDFGSLHIREKMELWWNAKENKKFTISISFIYCTSREKLSTEIQKCSWCCWNRDGKGWDENSFWFSGLEAWLPKGKVRTKWKSPGKGPPVFLLLFTSKSVSWEILLSPAPSPLWQESCQKGNKPSALEKTSRTGRKNRPWGKQRCQRSRVNTN